jgi:hypothetical protein
MTEGSATTADPTQKRRSIATVIERLEGDLIKAEDDLIIEMRAIADRQQSMLQYEAKAQYIQDLLSELKGSGGEG